MKTICVFIEKSEYGYSAYMDDTPLSYSCMGEGRTVKETVDDFYKGYAEMREYYKNSGEKFEEVNFKFYYDTPAYLRSLRDIFKTSGLAKITGINERQLGHYLQGVRKPRRATTRKIQDGVNRYLKEITAGSLFI